MIREKIIAEYVKGKDVLDIGSIGQSDEYLLWNEIKIFSRTLIGVDLPNSIDTAKKKFGVSVFRNENDNIVYGNMESINLNLKFDVVIAGDVIEHVSNPGLFLENIKRHLRQDGHLVITTPNAKWPTILFRPNSTHVLWHDIYTLRTLLKRHGFKINYFRYYYGNKPNYPVPLKILLLRQSILAICVHD